MTRAAAGLVLALALPALAPAAARADAPTAPKPAAPPPPSATPTEPPPDPAAIEAGDANLESISPRNGLMFTFALGGALSVGLGMANATGQGGAIAIRLAHVANRRSTVGVEIVGAALFFGVANTLYRTDATNFLISSQYYVNPALWLRGGAGWGRYAGDELQMGGLVMRPRVRYMGPAGSVGAGVDIVRLKRLRASVEVSSTAMINRDGVLSSNSLLLGLTID